MHPPHDNAVEHADRSSLDEPGGTSERYARTRRSALGVDPDEPQFALGTQELAPLALPPDELSIDALPGAAFLIGRNGVIEDLNELAEALVGYSRAALVGRAATMVLGNAGLEKGGGLDRRVRFMAAREGVRAHHHNGGETPIELLVCPDGLTRVLALATPVDPEPCSGIRRDEVAQIVHDLKNPLSTIALEVTLLEESVVGPMPARAQAATSRIARNIVYLEHMVHNLLDLSSIDAGRLTIHRAPVELRTLLEEAIERTVPTRDRERVFLEAPAHCLLEVDGWKIERVVSNLLENALKYAPAASGVVVRLTETTDQCVVSIIDAGPGLSQSEAEGVFEKYRRARGATGHDGSGLGLYVSKRIIEAHGGRVGVDSVRGLGSRFYFELPVG